MHECDGTRRQTVEPRDSSGSPLCLTVPACSLCCIPREITDLTGLLHQLLPELTRAGASATPSLGLHKGS